MQPYGQAECSIDILLLGKNFACKNLCYIGKARKHVGES